MPPDEYVEHANNSIFTNVVANYAVNTARWIACLANEGIVGLFFCYCIMHLDNVHGQWMALDSLGKIKNFMLISNLVLVFLSD